MPTEIPPRIAQRAKETCEIVRGYRQYPEGSVEHGPVCHCPLIAAALLACERETREADCGACFQLDAKGAGEDVAALLRETADALEEIAKGEGAYSMDQLTHAFNTIENMKSLAAPALIARLRAAADSVAPDGEKEKRE